MNTKMKKVNVTLEIPEYMEVDEIYGTGSPNVMAISLAQRKPRELKFREIIGRDYINADEYYTDRCSKTPQLWILAKTYFSSDPSAWRDTVIWELVNEC